MADRYLLESGAPDGYLLEDGTGVLLLEDGAGGATPFNIVNSGGDVGIGMCMAGNGGGFVG